jgi:hypothetical protein
MSWGAQNRSKDAKTPSVGRGMSEKPEPGLWPIQPYYSGALETAERIPPTTAVELRSSMLHRLFEYALDLQMLPKSEIEPSEHGPQSVIEPNATKNGRSLAGLRAACVG